MNPVEQAKQLESLVEAAFDGDAPAYLLDYARAPASHNGERRLWPLYADDQLDELPEPSWIVDGHVPEGLTVLYGPPKTGKTFLALDMALSVATGSKWFGNDVTKRPVLYVSGEGASGIPKRVRAWKRARNIWNADFYLVPAAVRLLDRRQVMALASDVESTEAGLVVVDTLARSMAGGDENSTEHMSTAIRGLDWVREKTGCSTLIIHHSGHEKGRPRGNSSLWGAVDGQIRVTGEEGTLRMSCDGLKDGTPFRTRMFDLWKTDGTCVLGESKFKPGGFAV